MKVISIAKDVEDKYPNTKHIDRFKYLAHTSNFAVTKDTALLVLNLESLLSDAATSKDIKQVSTDLLTFLANKESIAQYTLTDEKEVDNITNKIYFVNDGAIHIAVIIFNVLDINVENIKNSIADFNTKYFSLKKLTVNNMFLDDKRQLFAINNFEDKEKSIIYLNTLKQNWDYLQKFQNEDCSVFTICTSNYKIFYNRKNTEEYLKFFEKNYLK